jgi:outer membrane protein assembly factor BamB
LIGDVEGDGVDDVIGLISYSREPSQYLAAFSGKDGHRLWESSQAADDTTKLALTVATIVRGDAAGTVYAYALSTGAERWHRPAGERVKQLCTGESPDEILLETADQHWLHVPLQSGLMTPLADRGHQPPDRDRDRVAAPRCDPLQRADFGAINGATVLPDPPPKVDGMSIRHVLARGDGPRIAVGYRSPGTPVPMLAAFDAAGQVTWRIDVPASDMLRAHWSNDDLVTLTDGAVLLVYETNTAQPILVAIDRATGRRQWETAPKKVNRMIGIAVSRTAVALSGSGLLQVFDVEHGRAMYMIGR